MTLCVRCGQKYLDEDGDCAVCNPVKRRAVELFYEKRRAGGKGSRNWGAWADKFFWREALEQARRENEELKGVA